MTTIADGSRADATTAPPKVGNFKRAAIALGIALVFFTIFHVACGLLAVAMLEPTENGWQDLAFAAALVTYGALAVVALIPVAVFTVGLAVDVKTRDWPRLPAAVLHGVAGCVMGASLGGIAVAGALAGWGPALVAFALPPALAAFATHLVMPSAVKNRAIAWAAWALAGTAVVASLWFFVAIFTA